MRNSYGDTFQTGDFAGSTGSTAWTATSWTEVDSGGAGATTGYVQNAADGSERSVRFGNTAILNAALSRVVGDLTGYTSASINVAYRCSSLESGDVVSLQVRANGSAAWTSLTTFSNCNGVTYSNQILDLPGSALGSATEVRFVVTNAFDETTFTGTLPAAAKVGEAQLAKDGKTEMTWGAKQGRYFAFRTESAHDKGPYASCAELNLLGPDGKPFPRTGWKIS